MLAQMTAVVMPVLVTMLMLVKVNVWPHGMADRLRDISARVRMRETRALTGEQHKHQKCGNKASRHNSHIDPMQAILYTFRA